MKARYKCDAWGTDVTDYVIMDISCLPRIGETIIIFDNPDHEGKYRVVEVAYSVPEKAWDYLPIITLDKVD